MDMKRDYYEDIQLLDSKVLWFWFLMLIASLATFPFVAQNYHIYMANYMAINVIVTVGLNILVGYTGQISLGHAGFFAIGAYGTVLLDDPISIFHFCVALISSGPYRSILRLHPGIARPEAGRSLSGHCHLGLRHGHYPGDRALAGLWRTYGDRGPQALIRTLCDGDRQTALFRDSSPLRFY